jgi:hypothetical protein
MSDGKEAKHDAEPAEYFLFDPSTEDAAPAPRFFQPSRLRAEVVPTYPTPEIVIRAVEMEDVQNLADMVSQYRAVRLTICGIEVGTITFDQKKLAKFPLSPRVKSD